MPEKINSNLKLMAKCGFAILIIISLAILVERLTAANYSSDTDDLDIQDLILTSTLSTTTEAIGSDLNEEFGRCLTEHSKYRYFSAGDEKILMNHTEDSKNVTQNISYSCILPPEKCMHYFLIDFQKTMAALEVKLELIEPSVLFCLLPPARRYNLLTRGFSPSNFKGSRNVMTFGISEADAKILDKRSTRIKTLHAGFKILRFPKSVEYWPKYDVGNAAFEALHYIFKRHDLLVHLIVFYPRKTYMWYPGLAADINSTDLLFIDDGAYDNFTTLPFNLDTSSTAQIYLPSDQRCFLLATESSKFLECKTMPSDATFPLNSGLLNKGELQSQALATLKELKKVLGSQMVIFWLWSRTLLGWFEQCDILHYSSELELSVSVKSVTGYNFTALFDGSECEAVKQDFNLSIDPNVELNCKGMTVKISFMYKEKDMTWYTFHDELNSYKQTFPVFEVCSADVLGLKANVPCDTAKIFKTEFGENWRNISLSFNPKNMINLSTLN